MLRIKPNENIDQGDSFIEVDQRRKQISMLQPKNLNVIPQKLQNPNNALKLFAFDAIFEPDITQVYHFYLTNLRLYPLKSLKNLWGPFI